MQNTITKKQRSPQNDSDRQVCRKVGFVSRCSSLITGHTDKDRDDPYQGTNAEAMKNAVGTVTPTSVRAAATIITMLPIICIYPFLQKYFVTGLTLGGVKE